MLQEERSNCNLEDVANRRPACSTTISDPTLKEGQSALAVSERAGFDETGEKREASVKWPFAWRGCCVGGNGDGP